MKKIFRATLPLLALLTAALWFTHCKDIRNEDLGNPSGVNALVTFAGQVTDENGDPVINAQVQAGSQTGFTDKNGIFRLQPVSLPEQNAILKISATGYFDFTRAYVVENNKLRTVQVQLLSRNIVSTPLNTGTGGTAVVDDKVTLQFPANAVVKSDGSAYSGDYYIYARYLSPDAPKLLERMQGDLRGLRAGTEEGILTTYGMVGVEMVTPGGESLQIKPGEQVEMRMDIANSQVSNAPASLPLWYFDTNKARWIEEGEAQRVGNQYVGKVSHFTWWNCDVWGPRIILTGHVYEGDLQHPLANVEILICATGSGCAHGDSDDEGFFGGGAPKDVPLTLTVQGLGACSGQVLYEANIGSFSDDAVLPDIIIPSTTSSALTVTGRIVDCNNQAVTDGYVKIIANSTEHFSFTDANGNFSTSISCGVGAGTVEVKGFDPTQLLESTVVSLSAAASPADAGDLQACAAITEHIHFILDGQETTLFNVYGYYWNGNTYISGSDPNTSFQMAFDNNAQTGTFPLFSISVGQDSTSLNQNVTTTLTSFGNVGDFLIGTFMGTYEGQNGDTHTLSGEYRVKRSQ